MFVDIGGWCQETHVKVKVKVIGFSTDTTHGIRPYVKPGTPNPPTVAPPTAVTAW